MKNGKVTFNPGQKVDMRKENNERVRWLEEEEEVALRAVIQERFPEREPEFDLALHTGMRWSEQYRKLRWENVNVKLRFLTIPRSKSGKLRRVQLNKEALAALEKLRGLAGTEDLVCPKAYGREHRNWWKAALKESMVRDFPLARHSAHLRFSAGDGWRGHLHGERADGARGDFRYAALRPPRARPSAGRRGHSGRFGKCSKKCSSRSRRFCTNPASPLE